MHSVEDDRCEERIRMVEDQIFRRGIRDDRVLQAMKDVPRHLFVPLSRRNLAYEDCPLPIGEGQTISQPFIVALMIAALEPAPLDRVLEVGTGSGYAAAVLSRLVEEVFSIEIVKGLSLQARKVIDELGYDNVHLKIGDGSQGWAEKAPYDGILVSAGAPVVPESLAGQLAEGGRIVIPVGDLANQTLFRITRGTRGELIRESLGGVRFVPLVGEEGWEGL